ELSVDRKRCGCVRLRLSGASHTEDYQHAQIPEHRSSHAHRVLSGWSSPRATAVPRAKRCETPKALGERADRVASPSTTLSRRSNKCCKFVAKTRCGRTHRICDPHRFAEIKQICLRRFQSRQTCLTTRGSARKMPVIVAARVLLRGHACRVRRTSWRRIVPTARCSAVCTSPPAPA